MNEPTVSLAIPSIEQAIRALARVCDGAVTEDGHGFNGADAPFGHKLAAALHWTPRMRFSAWLMARKYRGQLAALGIDYDAIPEPPDPGPRSAIDREFDPVGWQPIGERAPDFIDLDPAALHSTAREILGPGGLIARQLPGYEHRDAQLAMADLVESGLDAGENVIVEAGTGTGKSLGYLVPAILSGKRTLVSTGDKALQAQIVGKDIPFLQSVMPVPFTAVLLKGRGNYLCLYHLDKAKQEVAGTLAGFDGFRSAESAALWPDLLAWTEATEDGDLESAPFQVPFDIHELVTADSDSCIGQRCPFVERCYSERVKQAAKTADVVVVNHALLLRDLEIRFQTDGHASVVPDVHAMILDEAHHLEDVATDAFGGEVAASRWRRIAGRLERLTVHHRQAAGGDARAEAETWMARAGAIETNLNVLLLLIEERLTTARVTTQKLGDERELAQPLLIGLADLAQALAEGTPAWLEPDERESWRKLGKQVDTLAVNLEVLVDPGAGAYVRYAELTGQGRARRLVLHVKPIEVAGHLRARLWSLRAPVTEAGEVVPVPIICTSATIAADRGMAYWRERVGCDEARELIAPSPFDFPHQALLYLPPNGELFDSARYRQEGSVEYLDRMADEIEHLLLASDGRAFVLFTSFRTLDEVYHRIALRLKWQVLKQGDFPRPELLQRFKAKNSVLFGVKSFWEGVDVQGEALSLVIIDKLPFTPPDDPVWEAKCDAVNRRRNDKWAWFNELAIPFAVIQLKQGFGRLIRTREDRGVVALLDGRLTTKAYGTRIVRALPPATPTRSLDAVRAFFGSS